ncbi:hypothetical protein [Agitococcus lubricus]|nr:hypothetical protein [Agitococcus lubricus]
MNNNNQGFVMSSTISTATLTAQSNGVATLGSAIVMTSSIVIILLLLFVGILAALVMMSLTPPRTRLEFAGMLSMAVASSCFGGPLVIEYYELVNLSMTAQLGICFMVAAPAWLVARIIANQLSKYRDAKSPVDSIGRDIKKIKKWF